MCRRNEYVTLLFRSNLVPMKIRWQLWFLVTLLICAFYCILGHDLLRFPEVEKLAQADWTYVEKAGHKGLADYCTKIGITGDGKTPQTVTKKFLSRQKIP